MRWARLNDSSDASERCKVCNGACVPKNIGNICVTCIDKVPAHIPDEQVVKFLNTLDIKKWDY